MRVSLIIRLFAVGIIIIRMVLCSKIFWLVWTLEVNKIIEVSQIIKDRIKNIDNRKSYCNNRLL